MPNLYGDILSDAAAGTIGGLGVAPSGCYAYSLDRERDLKMDTERESKNSQTCRMTP